MIRHVATIALTGILLAGCTTLSTYTRPAIPNAPNWGDAAGVRNPLSMANWWRSFGDSNLDRLVARVLESNNDMLAASVRVRIALLQAERSGLALMPTLTGSGNAERATPLNGGLALATTASSLGASYELDLWGRLSSEQDAARLRAIATSEDLLAARTTVIASSIEAYWRLAFANQNIAIAEQSLSAARKTLSLVESQSTAGAATELELAEVRQAVSEQAAALTDLQQSRVVARNTLATLLNGQPSPVSEPARLAVHTPVVVSTGLPVTLLSRRPDLRAAELRLMATLRNVDVTTASLYPQLRLTGNLGGTSDQLMQVLANPILTLGAGLTLPFLNFADGQVRLKVSEAEYELAAIEFRTTLLNAFADTANALSSRTMLAEKARRLRAALEAATTAARVIDERYTAGSVTLRVLLDAQERSRTAERAVVANRLQQLLNEVQIFRALGGEPVVPAAPEIVAAR